MADIGGDKADVHISTKDALHAYWPNRASLPGPTVTCEAYLSEISSASNTEN